MSKAIAPIFHPRAGGLDRIENYTCQQNFLFRPERFVSLSHHPRNTNRYTLFTNV